MATTDVIVASLAVQQPLRVKLVSNASLQHSALSGEAGGHGDSTGLMLWAGASALASAVYAGRRALFGSASSSLPRLCLELGCGCGLVGATAILACDLVTNRREGKACEQVASRDTQGESACQTAFILTDGSVDALALAQQTLAANGLTPADACTTCVLAWPSGPSDMSQSMAQLASLPNAAHSVHVLLAAEVVYPSTTTWSLGGLLWLASQLLPLPTDTHDTDGASTYASEESTSPDTENSLQALLQPPLLLFSYVPRAPDTTVRLACMLAACAWRVQPLPWSLYSCTEPGLGAVVLACRPRCASCTDATVLETISESLRTTESLHATLLASDMHSRPDCEEDPRLIAARTILGQAFPDALPALQRIAETKKEQEEEASSLSTWCPALN